MVIIVKINVVDVYNSNESNKMYINKQIKDRLDNEIKKYYDVCYCDDDVTIVKLYRKPNYTGNLFSLNNILKFIIYQVGITITPKKYFVIQFIINGNKIIMNASNPNEITTHKLFNSIDGVEVIINKQYYEWEYN
jgi:hypothetical protein